MLRLLPLLFALTTAAHAQQIAWREIPSPASTIVDRGVQYLNGLLFVKARDADSSLRLFVSVNEGVTWQRANFGEPLVQIDPVVRRADTSYSLVGQPQSSYRRALWNSTDDAHTWRLDTISQPGYDYPRIGPISTIVRPEGSAFAILFAAEGMHELRSTGMVSRSIGIPFSYYRPGWIGVNSGVAMGDIVYLVGNTFYEYPEDAEANTHCALSTDRGKTFQQWTGFANLKSDNLAAYGTHGILFGSRGFYQTGYSTDVEYLGDSVTDIAIGRDLSPFFATESGIYKSEGQNLTRWKKLEASPQGLRSVAIMGDSAIVVASHDRMYISSRTITKRVDATSTRTPIVRLNHSTSRLTLGGIDDLCSIELIDAIRGVVVASGSIALQQDFELHPELPTGVYFYRLRSPTGSFSGKLLLH